MVPLKTCDTLVLSTNGRTSFGITFSITDMFYHAPTAIGSSSLGFNLVRGCLTPDWADGARAAIRFGSEFSICFPPYFGQTGGPIHGAWLSDGGPVLFSFPEASLMGLEFDSPVRLRAIDLPEVVQCPVIPRATLQVPIAPKVLKYIISKRDMIGGGSWPTILRWTTLVSRGTELTWNSLTLRRMLCLPSKSCADV